MPGAAWPGHSSRLSIRQELRGSEGAHPAWRITLIYRPPSASAVIGSILVVELSHLGSSALL